MTTADHARRYTSQLGWYLVTMPAGSKGPQTLGWQQPERALSDPDQAAAYYTANPTHNMGLLHGPSGTAALDVDNVEHTRLIFAELGVDYDAIIASAPRIVGRPDRGKVLFRAPDGLKTHKISWPVKDDPRRTEVVFELRAGAVQDVLPPSVHPDTGNPYTWAGPDVFKGLPEIPQQLLILWQEWDRFRGQLQDMCPWRAPRDAFQPPRKPRPQGDRASVIDAFNAAHDINELLTRFGYRPTRRNRYLSPNSTSGLAGVVVFDDGRAYSHHASDPFDSAHTFDAFDLWCQYEHLGDVSKAVKEAAQFLDVSSDPTHDYQPEKIEHGRKVAAQIMGGGDKEQRGPLSDIPAHLLGIPGVLQEAVHYYNSTAPKDQPQFAVQAALAFASVVMGRRWVTDQHNMSGLYLVNVGKSAAGKEHSKTVLERLLEAAKLERLIGPSGYTSASGVFSALIQQPTHISIIDELGRVLQSAQATGNHHKMDAQTILMEVFGRQTSTLRPQGFSKMGMTEKQAKDFDRVVRCPSLTLLAMTTPSTLYDNLSSRFVSDGFLGRFLIVESHIGRQVGRIVRQMEPGGRLIEWAQECAAGAGGNLDHGETYDIAPPAVTVQFSGGCHEVLRACDADMLAQMDEHERFGLEAMFGRTKEIAQRLALIVARSRREEQISVDSLQWGIDYATFYALRTVAALRRSMADGPFEAACKAVFAKIEAAGLRGVTERELSQSVRAYAGMEPRRRREVLEALAQDRGVVCRNLSEGQRGRPRMAWFAPE
jgi:hypothetical protein